MRDDSPDRCEWLPIVPTTDVPLMLGIAYVLAVEQLVAHDFLNRYTVGYDRLEAYLFGKTDGVAKSPEWAAGICHVDADRIRQLARAMASRRTMIMASWSVQRAENGEQPYWLAIALAAMLGQIGKPGGGFGFGYGAINGVGFPEVPFKLPSLPQLSSSIDSFIPVSRITDMLLNPGATYRYNGQTLEFPRIELIYWAGGNPFHHHQDLYRLRSAWQRPEVVIAHEAWWNGLARHADIVLPATLSFERNDIACTTSDPVVVAARKVVDCPVDAKDDYQIFSALADRLGCGSAFTEKRSEEDWLRFLYGKLQENAQSAGVDVPSFEDFWSTGTIDLKTSAKESVLFADFRNDPIGSALKTPSGKIEIFSQTISDFRAPGNPGHPVWIEPSEWRGAALANAYPLHLTSNQPKTKLHSQYDHSPHSRKSKIKEREPLKIHPADAARRSIANNDIVRVFNDRGAFLASAVLSDAVMEGVLQIATGAWFDPGLDNGSHPLEKHGNPNVVTHDRGSSEIAQSTSANSCLVQVELFLEEPPTITCYSAPQFIVAITNKL